MALQWNPSKMDTIGEMTTVCCKEVPFIQGFKIFYKIVVLGCV